MKLQYSWNVSISFLCQPLSWPSHRPTHESIRWVIAYKYLSFKIFRCFVWLAKTDSSGLFFITIRRWPRLRSFGVIHLRISDLRLLGRIMENQVNRWILSESGFVGSFNASWSEWSQITNPDPDYPIRTYPNLEEVSNIPYRFDCILPKQPRFQTNISSINQVSRRGSPKELLHIFPNELTNSYYGYSKMINDWISDQNWIGEMQQYAKYSTNRPMFRRKSTRGQPC